MDNDIRKTEYGGQDGPSGGSFIKKLLLLLLTLLVVLAAVLLAAYFDTNSFDSLQRFFSYNKVQQDEEGKAAMYVYSSDHSNVFALLGEQLVAVSGTRLDVLNQDGSTAFTQMVKLASPAVAVGKKTAAVYDVGGTELYLINSRGLVTTLQAAEGEEFISVQLNDSDWIAITAGKNRYKASVSVYNASTELVFTFDSANRYIMDACVLPDCKSLAEVALGLKDNVFQSELLVYKLDSTEPYSTCAIGSDLAMSVTAGGGSSLDVLTENSFLVTGSDGTVKNTYDFGEMFLRGYSRGDFTALLFNRYRSGSAGTLVTLDAAGAVIARLDVTEDIIAISAAGRYLAVLYGDGLRIYTKELEGCALLEDTDYARSVIMREDGTALVVGSSTAWLFIP